MNNERDTGKFDQYLYKEDEDKNQEDIQWFSGDDDDMKVISGDSGNGSHKKRGAASKISRFATSTVLVCCFVGVAVFLAYFMLISVSDLLGLGQADKQIEVTLTDEDVSSLSATAEVLEDSGVISEKFIFEMYAKLKHKEGTFLAKTFVLNNKWGYDQIMRHLAADEVDIVSVTFREGMTQRQIGELLEEEGVCDAKDFYEALETEDFSSYSFDAKIPDDELRFRKYEGYIFPDTYEFYTNMNPKEVVKKFFNNFESKVNEEVIKEIHNLPNKLGELDNLITLASIIQKEATDFENMKMVSSVFHNCLNNNNFPYLQSDATKNYIKNDIRQFMTEDNQEMYAAYDTEKVIGLPIGPICNPGMDAIDAAIHPAETNYYFFVSDDAGNYYFAATDAEHEANKRKAAAVNRQLKAEGAAAASTDAEEAVEETGE